MNQIFLPCRCSLSSLLVVFIIAIASVICLSSAWRCEHSHRLCGIWHVATVVVLIVVELRSWFLLCAVEGIDDSVAGCSHRFQRASSIVVIIIKRGFDFVVRLFRLGWVELGLVARLRCVIPRSK